MDTLRVGDRVRDRWNNALQGTVAQIGPGVARVSVTWEADAGVTDTVTTVVVRSEIELTT